MIESQTTVENGFRETEIGLLPSDWDVARLGDVAVEFFGGGTPSTKKAEYWDGEILWTTSAYIDDSLYLDRGAGYITQKGLDESSSRLVPQGNLLIGTRVGVGKVAINIRDTAISQDLTAAIIDNSVVDREFLAYAIKWDKTQSAFLASMRGTTIKGIPRADLVRIPIPRPPLPQQRRIAAVLNAIQDAIAAQEDVIAEARALKRSLMQRLFTYGPGREPAETKETEVGEFPANWQLCPIAKIAELQYGYQTSIPKTPPPNGVEIISTAEILNEGILNLSKIRTVTIESKRIPQYLVRQNDILFNWRNAQAHVGKTAIVDFEPQEPIIFASFIIRIRPQEGTSFRYLHYLLTCLRDRGVFFRLSRRAVNQANFNASHLGDLRVPMPPLAIQEQIADLLAGIDTRIAAEEDRKAALQDLFKAALHQLMTGQIRV